MLRLSAPHTSSAARSAPRFGALAAFVIALTLLVTPLRLHSVRAEGDTWSADTPLTTARLLATATTLPDGRVLVAGGTIPANSTLVSTNSSELYDPVSHGWAPTGGLTTPRTGH